MVTSAGDFNSEPWKLSVVVGDVTMLIWTGWTSAFVFSRVTLVSPEEISACCPSVSILKD
jgi:hypothetical protein